MKPWLCLTLTSRECAAGVLGEYRSALSTRSVLNATLWTLYWRDRNLRFHLYDRLAPSDNVQELLAEVDRDPTCIFWG